MFFREGKTIFGRRNSESHHPRIEGTKQRCFLLQTRSSKYSVCGGDNGREIVDIAETERRVSVRESGKTKNGIFYRPNGAFIFFSEQKRVSEHVECSARSWIQQGVVPT